MRLWHIDIIPFLPKGQLLAQWRELNSIYAKEDKHVLINYIYEYPKQDLYVYSLHVIEEMTKRGYRIRSYDKMNAYFEGVEADENQKPYARHHNNEYLEICYYNLKEKFIRGQKDYEMSRYEALRSHYEKHRG